MCVVNNVEYIDFDEFVHNSGVKEATVKKRYGDIPGIEKTENGFTVLSGTRYPCDLHRYKLYDSGKKRYVLLKMISMYKYITHRDLMVEQRQFENMLRDLLTAGLISPNNLSNSYGANAYDCTPLGDEIISRTEKAAKKEIVKLIALAAGAYTGAVISELAG